MWLKGYVCFHTSHCKPFPMSYSLNYSQPFPDSFYRNCQAWFRYREAVWGDVLSPIMSAELSSQPLFKVGSLQAPALMFLLSLPFTERCLFLSPVTSLPTFPFYILTTPVMLCFCAEWRPQSIRVIRALRTLLNNFPSSLVGREHCANSVSVLRYRR